MSKLLHSCYFGDKLQVIETLGVAFTIQKVHNLVKELILETLCKYHTFYFLGYKYWCYLCSLTLCSICLSSNFTQFSLRNLTRCFDWKERSFLIYFYRQRSRKDLFYLNFCGGSSGFVLLCTSDWFC